MRPTPEDGSDTISAPATNGAGRESDLWRNGSPRNYRLRWQIPGNQFPRVEKSVMAQQAKMAKAEARENGENGQATPQNP